MDWFWIFFFGTVIFGMLNLFWLVSWWFTKSWWGVGLGLWWGRKKNWVVNVKAHQSGYTEILPIAFPKDKKIWYGKPNEGGFPVEIKKVPNPSSNLGVGVLITQEGIPENICIGEDAASLKDEAIFNNALVSHYNQGRLAVFSELFSQIRQSPWLFWLVVISTILIFITAFVSYTSSGNIDTIKKNMGTMTCELKPETLQALTLVNTQTSGVNITSGKPAAAKGEGES